MPKQEGHGNSKYFTEVQPKLENVRQWAEKGGTVASICKELGINRSTYYEYKKIYEDFAHAVDEGMAACDDRVVSAMLKRAEGYRYIEKTFETVFDPLIEKWVTKCTKEVEKELAPDSQTGQFWLKNRQHKEWNKEKSTIEITTNNKLEDFFK